MPWLRNNDAYMNQDVANVLYSAGQTVRTDLYRSRNPLDAELLSYIAMPFKLGCVPADKQMVRNRFKTVAMPRGLEPGDALTQVLYTLNSMKTQYNGNRHVTIYNTNSNQAVCPYIIGKLKDENGWTEHDYRTALTCNPFHSVVVLNTTQNVTEGHVVIFTNEISDEFILKLGAVLPRLYGYTIPDAITQAYLAGDKAAFYQAYLAEIAEIIANRKRAEIEQAFTRLSEWLSTNDTTRIDADLQTKERDIRQREEALRTLYRQLQDLQIRKASTFWGAVDNSIAEFINYVKEYDADKITRTVCDFHSDVFGLQLITKLCYWDEEIFRNYDTSARGNCVTERDDKTRALLRNIFLDRTVDVVFHTGIKIYFRSGTVQRYQDLLREGDSSIGLPHTHTYHHDCWGNNKPPIEKALAERNYLIAWEQIKSTLSGLNLADTIVFSKFVRAMAESNIPCLVLKGTGEKMSPAQFRAKYPQGYNPTPVATVTEVTETPTPTGPVRRTRRVPVPEVPVNPEPIEAVEADEDPFF